MIFVDRSVPRGVANALKEVRGDVAWLEDLFPHDVKDEAWLKAAGENNWLVITRDRKIKTRPGERRAFIANNVGDFCLISKATLTRWDLLKLLVTTLDEIERLFASTPRHFLYGVHRSGQIRRLF